MEPGGMDLMWVIFIGLCACAPNASIRITNISVFISSTTVAELKATLPAAFSPEVKYDKCLK